MNTPRRRTSRPLERQLYRSAISVAASTVDAVFTFAQLNAGDLATSLRLHMGATQLVSLVGVTAQLVASDQAPGSAAAAASGDTLIPAILIPHFVGPGGSAVFEIEVPLLYRASLSGRYLSLILATVDIPDPSFTWRGWAALAVTRSDRRSAVAPPI